MSDSIMTGEAGTPEIVDWLLGTPDGHALLRQQYQFQSSAEANMIFGLVTRLGDANAALRDSREHERDLRRAGQALANLAFNLAQYATLADDVRATLRECCDEWDSTVQRTLASA